MFITNFKYYIAKNKPIIYTKVFAKPNDEKNYWEMHNIYKIVYI